MRSAIVFIAATLVAGCAGQRASGLEAREPSRDVLARIQVRLPADTYTPTARALPDLHRIGLRACGSTDYRIADRRIGRSFEASRAYDPRVGAVVPTLTHSHAVIATIECLGPRTPPPRLAWTPGPRRE
jgi:hypothetical protein